MGATHCRGVVGRGWLNVVLYLYIVVVHVQTVSDRGCLWYVTTTVQSIIVLRIYIYTVVAYFVIYFVMFPLAVFTETRIISFSSCI